MKNIVLSVFSTLLISCLYSQEKASSGSYSIEVKSVNQANIELSDKVLIKIEAARQEDTDTTIKAEDYSILIMSKEKLEQELIWPQFKLDRHK